MKKLFPLLFLVACTDQDRQYDYVREQISIEHKAHYAKLCVKNECVCFIGYGANWQSNIPCSFYDKIEVSK